MAAEPEAERAPAKVNLFLHIRGRRADGYHLLDSLAVFPQIGDRLWAEPSAAGLSLAIDGPFGQELSTETDNLVLRAAEILAAETGRSPAAALRLEKNLPVASGIGGGSADAAAALRLLSREWNVSVPSHLALKLGADVPVCLTCRTQWMGGIGEDLSPAPRLPEFWMVLVNPLVSVSTGAVFDALPRRENPPGPEMPKAGLRSFRDLVDWLHLQRNDMEPSAAKLCPPVADVLTALATAPLARMSGSGATCFGLYETEAEALAKADMLRAAKPEWWVAASPVRDNALAPSPA